VVLLHAAGLFIANLSDLEHLNTGFRRDHVLLVSLDPARSGYTVSYTHLYSNYYDRVLELIRPGGLITADNVFWDGAVADPADHEADTEAMRAFNRNLHSDSRVELSIVPLGDGLAIAYKKP